MKQILIFTLVCFTMTTMAQKQQKHEKVAIKQTAEWSEVCELSDDQESKLLVVLTAKMEELFALKELHADDAEKLNAAKKEIHRNYFPKIKEVVGEENMKKMKEYKKQQKELKH